MAPYSKEAFKHLKRQSRVFLILNVVAALAMLILFLQIRHIQEAQNKESASIQRERVRAILVSCHQQNRRHDETIRRLRELLKQSGVSAARRRMSLRTTVLLIDALQPKTNCWHRAEKLVGIQK